MYHLKHALSLARQARTCPPPEIVTDPLHRERIEAHRAVCPYCPDEMLIEAQGWQNLSAALLSQFPETGGCEEVDEIRPGDLRFIRRDMAQWRERYYYTPPLVLVLNRNRDVPNACLVAQAYNDPLLAAPGDLILDVSRTGLWEAIFVEPWNCYTMKNEYLGKCIGRVDVQVLATILNLNEHPDVPPKGFPIPRPMADYDPREDFRVLEVEVGYTFASQSVRDIMRQMETPAVSHMDFGKVVARLKELRPGIAFPGEPADPRDMLMFAQPADYDYPAAAAGDDVESFAANIVMCKAGEPIDFRPVSMIIEFRRLSGNDLTLTGTVPDLPLFMDQVDLYVQLVFDDGPRVDAHEAYLLVDEHLFVAKFTGLPQGRYRPKALIVCFDGDGGNER